MKSEWKTSTIGAACSLVTDGSHSSPKSVESGEYMVSVKDFTEYGFDFTSCRRISSDDYETLKRNGCVPEQGDILIRRCIGTSTMPSDSTYLRCLMKQYAQHGLK